MKVLSRTDEEIKNDIINQLYWDSRVEASDINVEVSDGAVNLTGKVHSYTARLAAETDSLTIPGVISVVNGLEIILPEDTKIPTDVEILNNVINNLLCNPNIDSKNIDVSVYKSIVNLEGTVSTYWQKILSEQLAFDVAGVAKVENNLFVIPPEDIVDKQIAEAIKMALDRKPGIDTGSIEINVEQGVVTLSGKVSSWTAYHDIASAARYLVGVVNVQNNLVVE